MLKFVQATRAEDNPENQDEIESFLNVRYVSAAENANVRDLQRSARNRRSTLTDWFALNQCDPETRYRSYNRGVPPISRMYFVQPRDSEKYSLRLLLLYAPDATSFEYLRTYQDVEYPDFKAAA
ncbi:hypothetical protein INT45_003294 [Circinella minor]|uniref:Uncharacterized protein n=1 Tax=Circinella minor TaxID=1195481 RepID=A0A8H7VT53_9FUNG|nr:hypothetical protein INT45_003294 [Circinella minor]